MAYQTWGRLNPQRDNAVLVLHALTGDSHVVGPAGPDQPTPGWWDGLIGPGAPLDTDRFFAVAANVLGGCRGSTGPSSVGAGRSPLRLPVPADHRPGPGRPPRSRWPTAGHRPVRGRARRLDGRHAGAGMGRRLPGPGRPVASRSPPAPTSPATRSPGASRNSRRSGPTATSAAATTTTDEPPLAGMAVAREIAHTTYRSALELDTRFGRTYQGDEDPLRRRPLRGAVLPGAPRPQSSAVGSTRTPTWC